MHIVAFLMSKKDSTMLLKDLASMLLEQASAMYSKAMTKLRFFKIFFISVSISFTLYWYFPFRISLEVETFFEESLEELFDLCEWALISFLEAVRTLIFLVRAIVGVFCSLIILSDLVDLKDLFIKSFYSSSRPDYKVEHTYLMLILTSGILIIILTISFLSFSIHLP